MKDILLEGLTCELLQILAFLWSLSVFLLAALDLDEAPGGGGGGPHPRLSQHAPLTQPERLTLCLSPNQTNQTEPCTALPLT